MKQRVIFLFLPVQLQHKPSDWTVVFFTESRKFYREVQWNSFCLPFIQELPMEKVGAVGVSVHAPKVVPFQKTQGTGTGEKHQGLKFELSKYLIVRVSVWLFTYIQCKIPAPNCLQEHYRCQLYPRHKWKMEWQVTNCTSLSVHVYSYQWPPCFINIPFQTNGTSCTNFSALWIVVSKLSTASQRKGNENFQFFNTLLSFKCLLLL